jgi:hypothetical protein
VGGGAVLAAAARRRAARTPAGDAGIAAAGRWRGRAPRCAAWLLHCCCSIMLLRRFVRCHQQRLRRGVQD